MGINSVPNPKIALIMTFSRIDALYGFSPLPAVILYTIHYCIFYAASILEFKFKLDSFVC